jgi:mRNA-degrading endonuclease HigB of HigAB toxin-antitoxin module
MMPLAPKKLLASPGCMVTVTERKCNGTVRTCGQPLLQALIKRTTVSLSGMVIAELRGEGPFRAWFAIAAKAKWANPAEIQRQFGGTVDFVGDNRVIFDLGGSRQRASAGRGGPCKN